MHRACLRKWGRNPPEAGGSEEDSDEVLDLPTPEWLNIEEGEKALQHLTPPLNKGKTTTSYAWFLLFLPPLRKRGSKLPEHLFLLRGRRPQLWIWGHKPQLLQNGPRTDCHPDDHCLDPWGRAATRGGTSSPPPEDKREPKAPAGPAAVRESTRTNERGDKFVCNFLQVGGSLGLLQTFARSPCKYDGG